MPYGTISVDTILPTSNLTVTGNVIVSGTISANTISPTSNLTVGNVIVSGTISANTISPTSNLTVGNVIVSSDATANTYNLVSKTLGTATPGRFEYDGKVPYFTPLGTQRGVVPGAQFFALNGNLAGSNVNTAQKIYGVGVTLSSSTVYAFEGVYALSKSAGTTSHSFGVSYGGTATLNSIAYQMNGQYNSVGFTTTTTVVGNLKPLFIQTASNTVLITGITSATAYFMLIVKGIVSVDAGGTFIPQYTLSAAPGGAYTTQAGCYFSIYPIGAAGSNVSVGTWA